MDKINQENTLEKSQVGEIIAYHPEGSIHLDVRVVDDSVWLNRQQISLLFGRDVKTIGKHINNALQEELRDMPTVANFATVQREGERIVSRNIEHYNLDVILSVGYRVKSSNGVKFRRWANQVLKDHLLKGYSINQRLMLTEARIDQLHAETESRLSSLEKQVEFFVKANIPPAEGTIPAKSWWSGYDFAVRLIQSAQKEVVVIDPYANEVVVRLLAKRNPGVSALVYATRKNRTLQEEVDLLNRQMPSVKLAGMQNVHDRFIIVDETVYHIGASIKDLGKELTAFSILELLTKEQLLAMIGSK